MFLFWNSATCLIEQNRNKEVVDEEAFRQPGIVVAKEQSREDNDEILM